MFYKGPNFPKIGSYLTITMLRIRIILYKALLLLPMCMADDDDVGPPSNGCSTITNSRRTVFEDATYYYSSDKLSLSGAKEDCTSFYGDGHSYPTYVPGIFSERELMRLQYVFKSEYEATLDISSRKKTVYSLIKFPWSIREWRDRFVGGPDQPQRSHLRKLWL